MIYCFLQFLASLRENYLVISATNCNHGGFSMFQTSVVASATPNGDFTGPFLSRRATRRVTRFEKASFEKLVENVSERGAYLGNFEARSTSHTIGTRKDALLRSDKSMRRNRGPGFRRRVRDELRFARLSQLADMTSAQYKEWLDLLHSLR